ncbi:MAG: hypothetical protein SO111_04270, partial [Collinsella sp.]|nr:hypothetical protein [Collinsella sp.]
QFVIQKARHDQKVYALPFSCQLVRSGRRSLSVLYLRRCHGPDAALGDVPHFGNAARSLSILYLRRCLAPNAVVVGSHWGPLAVVAKTSVLPE